VGPGLRAGGLCSRAAIHRNGGGPADTGRDPGHGERDGIRPHLGHAGHLGQCHGGRADQLRVGPSLRTAAHRACPACGRCDPSRWGVHPSRLADVARPAPATDGGVHGDQLGSRSDADAPQHVRLDYGDRDPARGHRVHSDRRRSRHTPEPPRRSEADDRSDGCGLAGDGRHDGLALPPVSPAAERPWDRPPRPGAPARSRPPLPPGSAARRPRCRWLHRSRRPRTAGC